MTTPAHPPLERIPLGEPVSLGEELFWAAERCGETAPPFVECPRHVPIFLRLSGRLDRGALGRALHEIVRRHDPLRSTFHQTPHGVVRLARDPAETEAIDPVSGVDPRQVLRLLHDELQRPFDLESGPPMRARLFSTGDDDHVLALVVHHIVFDGWSARVLVRELGALYGQYATGPGPGLPDLGVRYADYVVRQRARLDTDDARRAAAYWEDRLRGATGIALGGRRKGDGGASPSSAVRFAIDPRRTALMRRFGRERRVTLAVVLAALFKLLLCRLTGSTDLVIGMPAIDRPLGRFDDLIGLFLNLVLLRTGLDGTTSPLDAIERVRDTFRGAYTHDLPYAALRRRVPGAEDLARVVFNVVNFRRLDPELPGLTAHQIPVDTELPSLADLSLHIGEVDEGLSGRFIYKSHLFRQEDVRGMAREYDVLIDELLADRSTRSSSRPGPAIAATEREIAAIWTAILGVSGAGAEASFIELGGDSITAAQCLNRIHERFGCEIPFGTFLDPDMTLGKLAALVDEARPARAGRAAAQVLG